MSKEDDDWALYEGKIQVEKPASPCPATRLGKTKPSKKFNKPTPKYSVRKDGTLAPYKAEVVNTLTQLDRDDRLVRHPLTRGDVPALKLRVSPSGFLIKIPSPKKEKEVIEIMSSDAESDVMVTSADGVAHYDSEGTVPSSIPPPAIGVYRPTESNGDGGPGGEKCVREVGTYHEIWRGPPGPGATARNPDGTLADEVVWKYDG